MVKSKKAISVLVIIGIGLLLLSGCGTNQAQTQAQTQDNSKSGSTDQLPSLDSLVKYEPGVTKKLSDDEIIAARDTVQKEIEAEYNVDYKTMPDKPTFLTYLTDGAQQQVMATYPAGLKKMKDSQAMNRTTKVTIGHVTVTSDNSMTILSEFLVSIQTKNGNSLHDYHGQYFMKKVNEKWLIDNQTLTESKPDNQGQKAQNSQSK
ncbi:hypothetical protein [Desulfitobacterium sp.]|uniref:hypothetical protein n=1 Tax=Desulfitobacterium sp. TaxID=49981 RepID=UPI002B93F020|nr:hypothetical protein [Desulfitobacterium sp.]HVJ49445.1 hypothetical protein [Desulfitobacterium sp.]